MVGNFFKDDYTAGGAGPGNNSMEVDGEMSVGVTQTIQHHPPQQNFNLSGIQQSPSGTQKNI